MTASWDLVQWSYTAIILLGCYFLGLSFVWLRSKNYKADPFFYYVVILVAGSVFSRLGTATARHYMLCGDETTRDFIISSGWWLARNAIPATTLVVMNIHATYRFIKRR